MTDTGNRNPEEMIEEAISPSRGIVLAFQHVLLMNAYVVPVILASVLGFTKEGASSLIQATFLASGITTLIQAKFFMKYPVVYGPSFVPLSAITGIFILNGGTGSSWSYVAGACLAGSATILLLGCSNQFKRILDYLISPVVGAAIVLCIGLSLIPLAFSSMIFRENGLSTGQNVTVSLVTIGAMIIFSVIGNRTGKLAGISRVGSGIFALIAGLTTASVFSPVDLSAVSHAALLSRPALPFLDFQIKFNPSSVLTMVVLYFVLMTETTGTWIATSSATGTALTQTRVNQGVLGLGAANIIGSLLGATPMSGYSSNAGILTITNTFSRRLFYYIGLVLILIGFSSKLSTFISIIPPAAIGGIFLITSGMIVTAGINLLKQQELGMKGNYILLVSVITAIGLNLLPAGALDPLPVFARYILGSSIASSALAAIILNKIIPDF